MKKKRIRTIVLIAAVIMLLAGVGVFAASNYGSSSDPLVSMSYINDVLTPALQNKFAGQLQSKASELQKDFASAVTDSGSYKTVALKSGQKLTCAVGSEILMVSGSAQTVSAGIVTDCTTGAAAAAKAALTANHLYMTTAAGAAVITSSAATVMVRGTATVSK